MRLTNLMKWLIIIWLSLKLLFSQPAVADLNKFNEIPYIRKYSDIFGKEYENDEITRLYR